jgi:periplasmic divalent cation tolerance protein
MIASSLSLMSEKISEALVVLMTAGSREEAARLAEMLVGARLAACVQLMPEMESVYHWQGNIERAPETLLIAKTTRANFEELERAVRALHSYETPEIVAVSLEAASAPYLEWLTASVLHHRPTGESADAAPVAGDSIAQNTKN